MRRLSMIAVLVASVGCGGRVAVPTFRDAAQRRADTSRRERRLARIGARG